MDSIRDSTSTSKICSNDDPRMTFLLLSQIYVLVAATILEECCMASAYMRWLFYLNNLIGTPYQLTIHVLKFEIVHFSTSLCVSIPVCMANGVEPDQRVHSVASDLGLHRLQSPTCCNS